MDVIPAADAEQWHKVLNQAGGFDFYHLPEYHRFAEQQGEGRGVLLVFQGDSHMAAWPFLLRPVQGIVGLESAGKGYQDATSVYGYPGPICTPGAQEDPVFLQCFGATLRATARDLGLVSMFSRLNPLINTDGLARSAGVLVPLGETIAIDLSSDPQVQWSDYRKSHRYEIRRARREGMRVRRARSRDAFDAFSCLYAETMRRVGAEAHYLFDNHYFQQLRRALGERLQVFLAELEGVVCSAALFVRTDGIIQYHFSGSADAYARLAPAKLIIDDARLWGNAIGARYLHLGGGTGSRQDSLFRFKAGFSRKRCRFSVWTSVILPEVYDRLVEVRKEAAAASGATWQPREDYYPAYRSP